MDGATAYATAALVASAALGAALTRWLASGAAATVAIAALPAVAGIAVAIGMARSRLFTSLQLLPRLASDPFGLVWDLFGTAELGVAAPLTPGTLWTVQLLVLLGGCIAGAVAAAPRSREGWPRGAIAAVILAAVGTTVVTLAPGL